MTGWLAQLFARSPFGPVCEHQHKVQQCCEPVPDLVAACVNGDRTRIKELAKEISSREQEADRVKTEVRDNLPRNLFMPVARTDILQVLAAQDAIADTAEDLAVLLDMREMEPLPAEVAEWVTELVAQVMVVVHGATGVVDQLDSLATASFGGYEARRVLSMIDDVDRSEHEADKVQDRLAKTFFHHEDRFKPAAIYLWMKIFNKIGDLANHAEKMTHRLRLFLSS